MTGTATIGDSGVFAAGKRVNMPVLLTDTELAAAVPLLHGWERDGSSLRRTVELPSFPAALDAVVAVGAAAEEMQHHPDIDIRWRTLTFVLSTHSAGGVTRLDLDLAERINAIVD